MVNYQQISCTLHHLTCMHAKSLQSCLTLCDPLDCSLPSFVCKDSPSKNTGVGCHALLQGIFPTQGPNSGLLQLVHCRHISLLLSHQGSPHRLIPWHTLAIDLIAFYLSLDKASRFSTRYNKILRTGFDIHHETIFSNSRPVLKAVMTVHM